MTKVSKLRSEVTK